MHRVKLFILFIKFNKNNLRANQVSSLKALINSQTEKIRSTNKNRKTANTFNSTYSY